MNTVTFPDTRKLEVQGIRATAADIHGWAETFEAAAAKAWHGVKAARKVETAVFRYARFVGSYMEGRFLASMITANLLDRDDLTVMQRRALHTIKDAFDKVEGTVVGATPWADLPHPASFKFTATSTLEAVLSSMAAIKHQCRLLQGDAPSQGAAA